MAQRSAQARLGPVDELDLRPVFQPIVDLRDGAVVGYEALVRGRDDAELHSAQALLAAARREDSMLALDLAARDAALRAAERAGLDAPFSLFLNTDPATLDGSAPDRPSTRLTLLVEVTEQALIARPEPLLRALTRLRTAGWGIALDDVGADSRSLALMSMLYPDVIKLDLRLLGERSPEDRARIVTAVGAEAERRRATVLAEGIDSEEQLAGARAFGATLGQGYLLGTPGPLPDPLPAPGRGLRLPGGAGDAFGPAPWERVTNWRRPSRGSRRLANEATRVIVDHAAELGRTATVLASITGEGGVVVGGFAPELHQATPTQVAEAVRIGPYLMPSFDRNQISDADLNSIARYVDEAVQDPDDRGGWGIGHLGPVPEGLVAWVLATAALLLVARLIGERSEGRGPEEKP